MEDVSYPWKEMAGVDEIMTAVEDMTEMAAMTKIEDLTEIEAMADGIRKERRSSLITHVA